MVGDFVGMGEAVCLGVPVVLGSIDSRGSQAQSAPIQNTQVNAVIYLISFIVLSFLLFE